MIKLTRKLFFMPRYEWDTSSLPRLGYPVHLHQRTLAIMHHTVTLDSDFTKNVWETEQEIKEHMLLLQTIRVSDVGADIAYHDVAFFMADGSVIICEGRGIHRSGAHTRGYTDDVHNNVGGYAVAAAGDFHNIDININRWITPLNNYWGVLKFDVPMINLPIQVKGHQQIPQNATACPGDSFMRKIARIRAVRIITEEAPDMNPILVIVYDLEEPNGAYYLSTWLEKRHIDNEAELAFYRALRVAEAGIPKERLDEIITVSA